MELRLSHFGTSIITLGPLILSAHNTKKWLMPQRPAGANNADWRRLTSARACVQVLTSAKYPLRECQRDERRVGNSTFFKRVSVRAVTLRRHGTRRAPAPRRGKSSRRRSAPASSRRAPRRPGQANPARAHASPASIPVPTCPCCSASRAAMSVAEQTDCV